MDPAVLVIDEVLAVGDQLFQQKCLKRLEEFKRSGKTIVFVSHNMQAIVSLCERGLLLRPNKPAILARVEEVAALYATADREIIDPRVTVHSFVLSDSVTKAPVTGAVAPGAALTLDVDIEARTSLPRCGFYFEVIRTDGLKMFTHTPWADGEPPVDVEPGMRLKARIHFRANVLRGTYRILLNVEDARRLWKPIELTGLASFVVHETSRLAGCAELEPSYEIQFNQPTAAR
jgi:energy-coupling factor transporter ATP-binding protein EcfA2